MKVAVIGGGFTGLACALELQKQGVAVCLYEKSDRLGGLAGGFREKGWQWSLEYFYHHIFTNDRAFRSLAREIGWKVEILPPRTTSFVDGEEVILDSPLSVLGFEKMTLGGRLRMGAGLACLKLIPNGVFLEKYRATEVLPRLLGKEGYEMVWQKLIAAKFGRYASRVNLAWFWSRVAKRTKCLGYPDQGFQAFAEAIGKRVEEKGGKVLKSTGVKTVKREGERWLIDGRKYDAVILTVPAPDSGLIAKTKEPSIDYLWSQTIILELEESLIYGYWMNILEDGWPFLVAVEQTNMISKERYGGKRIVYLGNYLEETDKQLKKSKEELIDLYLPYLQKINARFSRKWIKRSFLERRPFAQPVFPVNYSKMIAKLKTGERGLYRTNMSMVYPFDRGVNYAVEMGTRAAKEVIKDLQ